MTIDDIAAAIKERQGNPAPASTFTSDELEFGGADERNHFDRSDAYYERCWNEERARFANPEFWGE